MLKTFYEKTTVDEKLDVIRKVEKKLEEIKDLEIDIERLKKQKESLITDNVRFLDLIDWGKHDDDSRTITLKKKVGLKVIEYALEILENEYKELSELWGITKGED